MRSWVAHRSISRTVEVESGRVREAAPASSEWDRSFSERLGTIISGPVRARQLVLGWRGSGCGLTALVTAEAQTRGKVHFSCIF